MLPFPHLYWKEDGQADLASNITSLPLEGHTGCSLPAGCWQTDLVSSSEAPSCREPASSSPTRLNYKGS